MLQGLFFISLFLTTVIGIFLFRPDPIGSITEYSAPERVEARKKATREMAKFLVRNPKFLKQVAEVQRTQGPLSLPSPIPAPPPTAGHPEEVRLQFQGQALEFHTREELNQWIYTQTQSAPFELLHHLDQSVDPEVKLDLFRKMGEINPSRELWDRLGESCLSTARSLIKNPQGRDQQLARFYLDLYLERAQDPVRARAVTEEILGPNNNSSP